jgi:hypothetical protein
MSLFDWGSIIVCDCGKILCTNKEHLFYSEEICAPKKYPPVTYGDTNDSAVVTRIRFEYAQGIRVNEFLSESLWDSHWIQDRGNPHLGKINRDGPKFLSPLKV